MIVMDFIVIEDGREYVVSVILGPGFAYSDNLIILNGATFRVNETREEIKNRMNEAMRTLARAQSTSPGIVLPRPN